MKKIQLQGKFLPWILLILLSFIWGSSFILMKKGLTAFSYQQVATLRVFIAFLVLLPFTISHIFKIPKKYWIYLLLAAYLGNGFPPFLFTKAQTYLSSSMAGILNALTPLFTFIIGIIIFKTATRWYRFLGVILGLIGAVGLLLSSGGNYFDNLAYGTYVVLATICYALGTNIVKKYLQGINPLHITGFFFFVTGLPLGVYLFTTDFLTIMTTHEEAYHALGFIALLAIFGSALSLVLWNTLIQKTDAVAASSVTYIMPVFAIMWGLFDGEQFLLIYIPMLILILIGVYLSGKK